VVLFAAFYRYYPAGMATSAHGLTAPFGGRMWSKLLLAVAVCSFWPITGQAQTHHPGGDVAVAGNSDVPVANLSLYEVRRLFLGETRYWKGNLPVVLILPPIGTHERDVVLQKVYRMNEAQYKEYWIGRILRGEAVSAPKTAESLAAAQNLVASLPGCVTILNLNQTNNGKNVRILKIDGKLPGEKEYPLR